MRVARSRQLAGRAVVARAPVAGSLLAFPAVDRVPTIFFCQRVLGYRAFQGHARQRPSLSLLFLSYGVVLMVAFGLFCPVPGLSYTREAFLANVGNLVFREMFNAN